MPKYSLSWNSHLKSNSKNVRIIIISVHFWAAHTCVNLFRHEFINTLYTQHSSVICPPFPPASTMFAAASSSPNVSQLLDLHRESLARFDEVTLVQTLVNGRKVLTLSIGVPVDERRTARGQVKSYRKKEKEMEQLRAWREKKRQERVMTSCILHNTQIKAKVPRGKSDAWHFFLRAGRHIPPWMVKRGGGQEDDFLYHAIAPSP